MNSVHWNSLISLLGSKFLIRFHSPPNIEGGSVLNQVQPSQLFETWLTKRLHSLQLDSDVGFYCLPWLQKAITVVMDTYADLDKLLADWRNPMSKSGKEWITKYLVDYSAELLDVCNLITASISSVEQFQMSVKLVLHSLSMDSDGFSKEQLLHVRQALQDCPTICDVHDDDLFSGRSKRGTIVLQAMSDRHLAPKCGERYIGNGYLSAMYAVQVVVPFILGTVLMAFPVGVELPVGPCVSGHFRWSPTFHSLQETVREEICRRREQGSLGVLLELGIMYAQVRKVLDVVDSALECKSFPSSPKLSEELKNEFIHLQQDAETLENGLASFEQQIRELFQHIILKRSSILNHLSYLDL